MGCMLRWRMLLCVRYDSGQLHCRYDCVILMCVSLSKDHYGAREEGPSVEASLATFVVCPAYSLVLR